MAKIFAVVGQAGTGKTTWLMQKAGELTPRFLTADHHQMLVITRMHGSRRRLQLKLLDSCPTIPYTITTIDSFALSLLNRWRRALGYERPIQPVDGETAFSDSVFGTEASFAHILVASTELLMNKTVKAVIQESYPLVMIDEFQDCHGPVLDFVKALSICSALIVAADDFQLLDSNIAGCPAVDWLHTIEDGDYKQCTLTTCHRTSVQNLLHAARNLRDNTRTTDGTIPVFSCPNHGPAAFKIIEALVYKARDWRGTTAIISPSYDQFLRKVLASCDSQLQRKNYRPISWHHECAIREERKQLHECLGLTMENSYSCRKGWIAPTENLNPVASQVIDRAQRFSHLKGIQNIQPNVIFRYIDKVVHERRAYCGHSPKRIVTTVHGAKNREFDNVVILWSYKVPPDQEQQRRLLYNAVTRAKQKCMVLVLGDIRRALKDPGLSLLGKPKPAFPKKQKKKAGK
jgi:superfamily I DNA/RNA helicase